MTSPAARQPDEPPAAPARDRVAKLLVERSAFESEPIAMAMLDAIPGPALVLNSRREVVLVNQRLQEVLRTTGVECSAGDLPGDFLGCRHAATAPGACGSTAACQLCGANRAIRDCLVQHARATQECRIQTRLTAGGGALDVRAHVAPVDLAGATLMILALEDVSAEKRRLVLERTFFHDLLNTCGGVQGLAEILAEPDNDAASEAELKQDLRRLSGHAIEQIASHRTLLAAERGELAVQARALDLRPFLTEIAALYRHHEVAQGKQIEVEIPASGTIESDPALLGRVVGNLVKNALEATRAGGTVTVRADHLRSETVISVHNPGVIPRDVQLQLFQRSFSTKGGEGRGIGTYSVRLLSEQYLHARVRFVSAEGAGTAFMVVVPNRFPAAAAA